MYTVHNLFIQSDSNMGISQSKTVINNTNTNDSISFNEVVVLNESTCALAAKRGQLAILQWARQKRCTWDERTCSNAAANGHLAVLQWARQNGSLRSLE